MSEKTKLRLELIGFTVATVVIVFTIMPWIFKIRQGSPVEKLFKCVNLVERRTTE